MSDAPERIWIEMGNIARVTLMDTGLAITYEKQVLFDGEYVRADRIEALEAEKLELEQSFDLRWKADMRGIKRWQNATGRELVWPDHADLIVWLLERIEALEQPE